MRNFPGEKHVSKLTGVWIDHRKAVIVELADDAHARTIASNVEKHPERGGDSPMKGSYEARQVPADDSRQRALTGELNIYYDAVIAALHETSALVIFGPGEAKGELHTRLSRIKPSVHVMATEPADKMTDPEVIARARAYFLKNPAPPTRARG